MAKLEEIAELLTDEIEGFNQSIKKLEGVSNKINNVKFNSDISNILFLIEEQKRELKHQLNYQNRKLQEISKNVSNARIFPNWLVVLFFVLMIMTLSIIGFLFIKSI
jgi:Family of unknown function (DUF6730)